MKLKNEKGKSWRLSYWTTRGRIGIRIALIMTLASLLWPVSAMATGIDAKLVAAPLVGLPYVLLARKDIRRPEDLKGKSIGVTRPGDLSFRLSRAVLKKLNLTVP